MPAATYGPTASPTAPPPPSLGYGQRAEAPINAVNQWMRSQPWYVSLIRSFGQDPANVHLNDSQKQAVIKAAQANGVVVDEGHNGQEVDDSGNFQAKSHAVRNTLIVAGIAAAALATAGAAGAFAGAAAPAAAGVEAGASAGLGAAASSGTALGGLATLPGLGTAAAGAGTAAGATAAGLGAAGGGGAAVYGPAAAGGGLTVTDALKYGLPTAGNIIGGLVSANAAGKASDAQQKYLEEALAFEKQKDTEDRQLAANKVQLEANRYATYSANIAPYLANGAASGNRMTSLLGLPAGAPNAGGSLGPRGSSGGAPEGNPLDYADKLSASDRAKVDALLKKHNSSDNPAYWYGVNAMHGGFDTTGADWNDQRIGIGDGAGKGYAGATSAAPPITSAPMTTQPQARSAEQPVTLKAPDGSTKQVPASQLSYWISKGAQQVSA